MNSDADYEGANAVLRGAARTTLLVGGGIVIVLTGLIVYKLNSGARFNTTALVFVPLLLLYLAWGTHRSYRSLAGVELTPRGIERQSGQGVDIILWADIEEIQLGRRGMRIRSRSGQVWSPNLNFAGNAQPLLDAIAARRPENVRLNLAV